ncbi:MAG: YbjQ family protein [Methylophilaceae bacterium]
MAKYAWKCPVCDTLVAENVDKCANCGCPENVSGNEIVMRKMNMPTSETDIIPYQNVVTSQDIAGYKIIKSLGMVRGITVRSRSVIGNFVGGLETIFGGRNVTYTELSEASRKEAFQDMCTHAFNLGANGIIAVRYDATEVMPSITEVLCYGTAVVIEPLNQ